MSAGEVEVLLGTALFERLSHECVCVTLTALCERELGLSVWMCLSGGAGGDGFLQLQVCRRKRWRDGGGTQVTVTRLTHVTVITELLTRHRHLLITAATAENIPTVPAVMLPRRPPDRPLTPVAARRRVIREPLCFLLFHLFPAGLGQKISFPAALQTVRLQVILHVWHRRQLPVDMQPAPELLHLFLQRLHLQLMPRLHLPQTHLYSIAVHTQAVLIQVP